MEKTTALTSSEDGTLRVWDVMEVQQKTVIKPQVRCAALCVCRALCVLLRCALQGAVCIAVPTPACSLFGPTVA